MIKNNRGVTMSILVVTIIVIMILAGVTITTSNFLIRNTKAKAVISNMYLVKAKAESLYEEYEFSGDTLPTEDEFLGKRVTVSSLRMYNVESSGNIEEDNTWYIWTETTVQNNGLDTEMLSDGAEYIVNYATGEVIYTTGVKDNLGAVNYKLTDMVK